MVNKFSALLASAAIATSIIATLAAAPAYANNGRGQGQGQRQAQDNSQQTPTVACSLQNISIGGVFASQCDGPRAGNDTNGTLFDDLKAGTVFDNIGANDTWALLGKSDDNSQSFITAPETSSGNFNLGQQILNSGLNTFAISLKAGNSHSVYLFQDIDFATTGLTGFFNTFDGKDLSHASLYAANYITTPDEPSKSVPEPATLAALAFFAVGAVKGLKKNPLVQG